jgi:hypothetical protein
LCRTAGLPQRTWSTRCLPIMRSAVIGSRGADDLSILVSDDGWACTRPGS